MSSQSHPGRDSTLGLIQPKPVSHVNGNIMLSRSKHQRQTSCTRVIRFTYSALTRNLPICSHAKVHWSLSLLPCSRSTASVHIQRWQPTHQAQLPEAFAQVSTHGWLLTTGLQHSQLSNWGCYISSSLWPVSAPDLTVG